MRNENNLIEIFQLIAKFYFCYFFNFLSSEKLGFFVWKKVTKAIHKTFKV